MPDQPTCHITEHGTWIKRRRPSEHRCLLPELNQGLHDKVTDGDEWQCHDCHTVWTVQHTRSTRWPWQFRKATEAERA